MFEYFYIFFSNQLQLFNNLWLKKLSFFRSKKIYTGKEFKEIAAKNEWELVKFLKSNDLSSPQIEHHRFHYKLGINSIPEDKVNLDINKQCSAGGLYFTYTGVKRWTELNCFFVDVPDDARVLMEGDKKFKTDKLILIAEADDEWYAKNLYLNFQWIAKIDNQTEQMCMDAIKYDACLLRHVKNQTREICLVAVRSSTRALSYVKNQTPEICLAAVCENGLALRYVKLQTDEVCLAAVLQNGLAIMYVKDQTVELCIAAVLQNDRAVEFVKNQTFAIQQAAISKLRTELRATAKLLASRSRFYRS